MSLQSDGFIVLVDSIPVIIVRDRGMYASNEDRAREVQRKLAIGLGLIDLALKANPHGPVQYTLERRHGAWTIMLLDIPIIDVREADADQYGFTRKVWGVRIVRARRNHWPWGFEKRSVPILMGGHRLVNPYTVALYWRALLEDATLIARGGRPRALIDLKETGVLSYISDLNAIGRRGGDATFAVADVWQSLVRLVMEIPPGFREKRRPVTPIDFPASPVAALSSGASVYGGHPDPPEPPPPHDTSQSSSRLHGAAVQMCGDLVIGSVSGFDYSALLAVVLPIAIGGIGVWLWRRSKNRKKYYTFQLRAVPGSTTSEVLYLPPGGVVYLNGDHADLVFNIGSTWRICNTAGALKLMDDRGGRAQELSVGRTFPVDTAGGIVGLEIVYLSASTARHDHV
ncbi:MAG: hypothetical protein JST22_20630 [Bacteroidetes bacterium]|nr:hypothetical protein [Bacteroidota bacterium]